MEIEFDWDEANEEKLLARHNVRADEAEQCFFNGPLIQRIGGPSTYIAYGVTDGGRYLFLVYQRKPGNVIRIYSARDLTAREKRRFRRR